MSNNLTIEWLQVNIANWQCLENGGHTIPKTMIPMAKQLLSTIQREMKLREALEKITKVECPYVMFDIATEALSSEYPETKINKEEK